MKKATSILVMLLAVIALHSQSVVGSWTGVLTVPDMGMGETELTVLFHVKAEGDGYSGTLDSPDQGAFGLPVDEVTFKDSKLTISYAEIDMEYVATLGEDDTLKGTLTQGGGSLDLNMTRVKEE